MTQQRDSSFCSPWLRLSFMHSLDLCTNHTLSHAPRARVLCGSTFCARTFRRAIFSLLLGLACNCPGNHQLCAINHSSGTLCSPACARSTYREPRKSTSEEQWGLQIAFKRVKKKKVFVTTSVLICQRHNFFFFRAFSGLVCNENVN